VIVFSALTVNDEEENPLSVTESLIACEGISFAEIDADC